MFLRDLCIIYEVCLLKVCLFYFLFFREHISVTYKVDGEQSFGAAPAFCRWLYSLAACLFPLLYFCCLKTREDESIGHNIMHFKTKDRRNGEDALFQRWKTVFLSVIHAMF